MINVKYFSRKPIKGYHSIEMLFSTILKYLPEDILPKWNQVPFQSMGCIRRILNTVWAPFHQGKINHITGDIHYISFFLNKRRTLLTIHDLEIISRNKGIHCAILLFIWFYMPIRRVRYISVISEFTKKELLKYVHVPEYKIKVIPDCLPGVLPYSPKEFNSDCPTILQVGTKANKNLNGLIKALNGISCHLIILGNIDEAQKQMLEQNSIVYVCFSGLTYEQVIALYIQTDLLVFASLYEGFGLPILEAQSVGRPVVTSNVSSMPEVAGGAAILIDPFDINSIREGILSVIQNDAIRNELVQKGLENVKRFHPQIIAEKYAALYREMVL